jgi:hypothetical protein
MMAYNGHVLCSCSERAQISEILPQFIDSLPVAIIGYDLLRRVIVWKVKGNLPRP